eukprot:GFUD01032614.1.p1 GENE.GFUD01032614.1~~GFUD01032614.1.p1  ORF type:complete len:475 (-),score=61.04 GFUD01032614.1:7-1431(-)
MDKRPLFNDGEKKRGTFGVRHMVIFMGFLGFANVYAMRVNLSVAIVAMVNNTALPKENTSVSDSCPNIHHNTTHKDTSDGPFDWDEQQQGTILGMFFYGYVLTQVPGGRLAELFGGKWLFGIGILITAVFTLLTPVAANHSLYFLYAVRIIEGLGEGVTFPAMLAMLARWSPPQERSRFTSFTYAGAAFGTVISMPASGYLCDYVGWESVFYVFGAIGIVWFVGWCFLVFDGPDVHPRISEEEKAFIQSSLIECETGKPSSIPWLAIASSPAVWAITATHVTQNFGYYVLLTELPTYMKNILHFDMHSNAILSGVPYLCMWLFSIVGSITVDHIIGKNYLSTTVARKVANTIATMGPALALLGASFVGCHPTMAMVLLTIAIGCNGIIYSGEQSAMLDIANNFAGTLMGIINALGNTMGFLAPMVTGLIINHHDNVTRWKHLFWIASATYAFGNTIFAIFGTSVEQKWNRIHHS